jgi:hypothetical protein
LNNRTAYGLAGLIFAAVAIDFALNNGDAFVFLVLKFLDLMEYAMFWR